MFQLNKEDYMSKIKIKFIQLFGVDAANGLNINQVNPQIDALINLPAKGAQLRYDLQSKLGKAIEKAFKEFEEERRKLLELCSLKKEVEFEDGEKKTIGYAVEKMSEEEYTALTEDQRKKVIHMIDGQEVGPHKIENRYDVTEEFHGKFNELLNVEIELNCYPIKLSRIVNEELSFVDVAETEELKSILQDVQALALEDEAKLSAFEPALKKLSLLIQKRQPLSLDFRALDSFITDDTEN